MKARAAGRAAHRVCEMESDAEAERAVVEMEWAPAALMEAPAVRRPAPQEVQYSVFYDGSPQASDKIG